MYVTFADTFYWIALTSTGDSVHRKALTFSRSIRPDRIVTTEEVMVEYLAYFSGARPSIREHTGTMVSSLLTSRKITVVEQTHKSFVSGLRLYRARPDKD